MVLLTVDEARPTHQPVTPESSSNDEASLHAIAQSTIKQLKAKADGHEEENGRLKVCVVAQIEHRAFMELGSMAQSRDEAVTTFKFLMLNEVS